MNLVFIGVATHRLSSVSLLASLTNRTRCSRCAWSTRWSSRTGVTAITLQEANKRVGQITGSVKQTRLLVFDYWCGSNLDSSSTVSSRRTVRSRVSLSHGNTTSGIISLHLPPAQMSCWIRTPRNHTSTNTTNVYTMQITAYFESTLRLDCRCLTSLPDSPEGPVRPGGPTGPGGPRSPPVPGAPCFPGSPWNKRRDPLTKCKGFSFHCLDYILLIVNSYRQDSTSSSWLPLICQWYSTRLSVKKESWFKKWRYKRVRRKIISGATARKAVLFPCKWKMTKSRDAQKQSLDLKYSCQDWVAVFHCSSNVSNYTIYEASQIFLIIFSSFFWS